MYTLLECLVIAGIIFVLSAVLFLIASIAVLVDAGVRQAYALSLRFTRAFGRACGAVWAYRPRLTSRVGVVEAGFENKIEAGSAAKEVFVE